MTKDEIITMLREQLALMQEQNRELQAMVDSMQKQLSELLMHARASRAPTRSPQDGPSSTPPPKARQETSTTPKKPKRTPLPEHLERIVVEVPMDACPACSSEDLERLHAPEVSEKLDYVPARACASDEPNDKRRDAATAARCRQRRCPRPPCRAGA